VLPPSAGACDFVEDPRLDARRVRPQWLDADDAPLRVHVAAHSQDAFCLWHIAGRKQLTLGGANLLLEAAHLGRRLRACIDPAIHDGTGMETLVPLHTSTRARLPEYHLQAAMLHGTRLRVEAREATRSGLLHLRALQALDGQQHGASHRQIAEAVFGEAAVRLRWSADGELRAQVRHLLARAHEFLNGGYRELARKRVDPYLRR
jgi:hypothetical protein